MIQSINKMFPNQIPKQISSISLLLFLSLLPGEQHLSSKHICQGAKCYLQLSREGGKQSCTRERLTGSVRVQGAPLSSLFLRLESSVLELTFGLAFSFSPFLPYLLPFKPVMISKIISIIIMILHKEVFKQFLVMKNESLKRGFAHFIMSLYITVRKPLPHLVTMQSIQKSSFQ